MREGQLDAWATPGAENGQQTAVLLEEGGVCLVPAGRWDGVEQALPSGRQASYSLTQVGSI